MCDILQLIYGTISNTHTFEQHVFAALTAHKLAERRIEKSCNNVVYCWCDMMLLLFMIRTYTRLIILSASWALRLITISVSHLAAALNHVRYCTITQLSIWSGTNDNVTLWYECCMWLLHRICLISLLCDSNPCTCSPPSFHQALHELYLLTYHCL